MTFKPFRLGRYVCFEVIGTGSMATVYLAKLHGFAGFEKQYAIKRIHPHLSEDRVFVQHFIADAKLNASLDHGNIVRVLEFGEAEGSYHLVMEHVDGVDLAAVLAKLRKHGATMPVDLATFVVLAVAEALDYAHNQPDPQGRPVGIVHEDLNPSKIMLTWEGGIRILDFGVARALVLASQSMPASLTAKLGYKAPEQLRGGEVDARTDLFCLGEIYYELLTGAPLFGGASPSEVARRVERAEIPAAPALDPLIAPILRKLVARSPDDRFAYASALILNLARTLFARRSSASSTTLAAWLGSLFGRVDAQTAEEPVTLERSRRATTQPLQARAREATATPAGDRSGSGRRAAPERRERTPAMVDSDFEEELTGAVTKVPSDPSGRWSRPGSGSHAAAFDDEEETASLLVRPDPVDEATAAPAEIDSHRRATDRNLQRDVIQLNRTRHAEGVLRQALLRTPDDFLSRTRLGELLMQQGRHPEAEAELRRAVTGAPQLARAWTGLGLVLGHLGRGKEAVAAHRRAVAATPDDLGARLQLAVALTKTQDLAGAIVELDRVVVQDPRHGRAHLVLAMCHAVGGHADAARRHADLAERLGENPAWVRKRLAGR
jgi:serine/threonine protein kinase